MLSFSLPHALVVFLSFVYVSAHSVPPAPLTRVEHPTTFAIEILPRAPSLHDARAVPDNTPVLRHSDAFRLTFAAFGETFLLHLRPNTHLLHPDAVVEYFRPGPPGAPAVRYATKPLRPEDVRAYQGEVVLADWSEQRMREDAAGLVRDGLGPGAAGWARVLVHDHGDIATGTPPVFEGAFSYHGIVHHVHTRTNYLRTRRALDPHLSEDVSGDGHLVIWRESDLMSREEERAAELTGPAMTPPPAAASSCAHDRMAYNVDPKLNLALRFRPVPVADPGSLWYDPFKMSQMVQPANATSKRDDVANGNSTVNNFANSIGKTTGCPLEKKIVFTGVAADCEYTSTYGTVENATTQILNDWNSASNLYTSTFNVSLGIINLQVHDPTCPTAVDQANPWNVPCSALTLDDRLSVFSQWRATRGDDGAGLWHLLSGCPTGSEVGIAWLGVLCQSTATPSGNATVSGTAVSTAGRTEWQVVAHETGHNFGAIHDCASGCAQGDMCCPLTTSQCNANASFLMSPVANTYESKFSPCSIGNICSLMTGSLSGGGGFTNRTCLASLPASPKSPKLISLLQCGNGIVEQGEDCDPGSINGTVTGTSCCTAQCKFASGAVCDPTSSTCCTSSCGFAPSTTVCRAAKNAQCDVAETCTGNSSSCPTDTFKPNGLSCGSGLACASGMCTSNDQQCQRLGTSMNLQKECPAASTSCSVSCQDPNHSHQCITLQSTLVDGSPCGFGGQCSNGQCQAASLLVTAKSWFLKNLPIGIPIVVAAGIIALLILWGTIRAFVRCCCRPRAAKPVPINLPPPPPYLAPAQAERNVLRRPGGRTSAEPGLVPNRPSPSPEPPMRQLPYPPPANNARPVPPPLAPAGGAYSREMRSDGDWITFGGADRSQGPAGNTYSSWAAPR